MGNYLQFRLFKLTFCLQRITMARLLHGLFTTSKYGDGVDMDGFRTTQTAIQIQY